MNIGARYLLKTVTPRTVSQNCLYTIGRTFSFKSAFSLDKLHPKSSLKITTPQFIPESPDDKFSGYIPVEALDITYSRSSGPGGQSVNTSSTKVDLRFHVKSAKWLHNDLKDKLIEKYYMRVNKDGYIIIKSDLTRSQQLNLADALDKLRTMIRSLEEVPSEPSPESLELKRKRLLKAARERVHQKRMNSMKREDRRGL